MLYKRADYNEDFKVNNNDNENNNNNNNDDDDDDDDGDDNQPWENKTRILTCIHRETSYNTSYTTYYIR